MTDQKSTSAAVSTRPERCPACGQPLDVGAGTPCTLCGWTMPDDRVTSEDHSPYAVALNAGRSHWWTMCGWVYSAGSPRLSYLSLSRPSRASRRFARRHLLLLGIVGGLAAAANVGWFIVKAGPGSLATTREPSGRGWVHVVARPAGTGTEDATTRVVATDAWWNLPLAGLVGAAVLLAVVFAGNTLVSWSGRRAERLVARAIGHEERMRCAVHYSCAWCLFATLAAGVLLLRPVVAALGVRGAVLPVPLLTGALDASAILVLLAGGLLWWFWLIRLAGTLPARHRGRLHLHFLFWTPLVVVGVAGAAAGSLVLLIDPLAAQLRLNW